MFRKITIEVTGGDARDLVVRLMQAVNEAVRMILTGETGVSVIGAFHKERGQVTLEEFDPCLPDSELNPAINTLDAGDTSALENIPDTRRENGY